MKQEQVEEGEGEGEGNICEYLLDIMKNYSDSVIPSFSQLSPEIDIPNVNQEPQPPLSRKTAHEPDKERKKRASHNDYYITLQSMLPGFGPNKVPRSSVVSGAVDYIKELKEYVQVLEGCKQEKQAPSMSRSRTYTSKSSNVDVTVSGEMALFVVSLQSGKGLVAKVLMVFDEEHKAEVLTANVTINAGMITLTVTAILLENGGEERNIIVEMIKAQIEHLLSSSSSSSCD